MSSDSHVDSDMLNGLKELLGEKFTQLIDAYINDGTARIERLETAVNIVELPAVCMEAHALKGSSNNIGAQVFAQLCGDLEHQTRAGDDSDLIPKVAAIAHEFAAITNELETYL